MSMAEKATAQKLMAAGLSRSFAHHVMAGSRSIGIPLALWLLDECGVIAPSLEGKTKRELDLLRTMYAPRAPASVIARRASVRRAA